MIGLTETKQEIKKLIDKEIKKLIDKEIKK